MDDRKEIDRQRDSAVSMTVGDESEGAVTGMMTINERFYIIKKRAIYRISLADEIDPSRTRADIPNTQQLVVNAGSESEIVCRILLQARELFREHQLVETVDWSEALTASLEILKDVFVAHEIANAYLAAKAEADTQIKPPDKGGCRMPAIPGIEARTKSFIQKADHAVIGFYRLCCVFYPEGEMRKAGEWLNGFSAVLKTRYDAQDPLLRFAEGIADFCKFLRNTRHCIEHERETQKVVLRDYELTADRLLVEPMIQVVHDKTPHHRMPLGQFMQEIVADLLETAENLMAYLADRHVAPGELTRRVCEIPGEQRGGDGIRFGYLTRFGDQVVRLS